MAKDGSLQKTTDGGAHWTPQLTLTDPKLYARDMRFLDERTGFVMPLDISSGQGRPALYATADGVHWARRSMPAGATSAGGMDFVSASDGYVLVDLGQVTALFHTSDGGLTWQRVTTGAAGPAAGQLPDGASIHLEGMRFLDPAHGWIAATRYGASVPNSRGLPSATPSFFATADGGRTWQQQPLPLPAGITYPVPADALEPPHFTDPLHAYAFMYAQQPPGAAPGAGKFGDQAALVFETSDGGRTWSAAGVSPGGALVGAVLNERDLVVLTDSTAYTSPDAGATWQQHALPARGSWVDFPDPRDGFAGDPGSSALLVTHDGGRTWTAAG
jgi:photosystem II stability/assembly factor-like uncharacterized protein